MAVVDPKLAAGEVATRFLRTFAPGTVHTTVDRATRSQARGSMPHDGLLVIGSADAPLEVVETARAWADALA